MVNPVAIRAANPTFEDGLLCARYANVASEGFMRVMFGRRFEEIMATAFAEPGHDLSYEHVTFALLDGVVVGMILAYTAEQHRGSSLEPVHRAAGRFRLRLRIIEVLLAPVMRLNDWIANGDYYLQFIAVDEAGRAGGVGSVLMDALEERARASGSTRLALDVSTNNEVARPFYERRGWTVESVWPKSRLLPTMSIRMTKPL